MDTPTLHSDASGLPIIAVHTPNCTHIQSTTPDFSISLIYPKQLGKRTSSLLFRPAPFFPFAFSATMVVKLLSPDTKSTPEVTHRATQQAWTLDN
jgi:hypothetical protein